jgi:hypothetical protein
LGEKLNKINDWWRLCPRLCPDARRDPTSISVGSLSHPAKFAEQDRVLDNRFRLSGLAPAIEHRHRKVHVGCHHPHNALMGRTLTPAARAAAATDVRSGFSVVPARLMPKVLMLNQR